MMFKRYFWGDDRVYEKYICGLLDDKWTIEDVKNLCNWGRYERSDFGELSVSFEFTCRSKSNDLFVFEGVGNDDCDYMFAQNYTQVITGKYHGWELVRIDLAKTYLAFIAFKFNENEENSDDEHIFLKSFPLDARIIVKSPRQKTFEPDTYEIRNIGKSSKDMDLIVYEYKDSKLLRSCEFGEDEGGTFELITEP